jgi:miniconductance mechanosensitive channel
MTSIKICSKEMIERFKKIDYLKDYIEDRVKEIEIYNKENRVNTDLPINGRQLTNLGVFRVYVTNYLKNRVDLLKGSTTMVRQLAPGENGIPIELYLFIADTRWVNYESIQADIFDHILAVVDFFDLRLFQNPTGYDIRQLKKN